MRRSLIAFTFVMLMAAPALAATNLPGSLPPPATTTQLHQVGVGERVGHAANRTAAGLGRAARWTGNRLHRAGHWTRNRVERIGK